MSVVSDVIKILKGLFGLKKGPKVQPLPPPIPRKRPSKPPIELA